MAINVNQITAQLARMPDQSLRTLAQMHKSDPYIMALVAGESARRQEIRTASTAQAPDAMPPVNEQVIASLPEEQGIARIPMQTQFSAEGGIVGYDDGGVVRFQSGGTSDASVSERLSRFANDMYDRSRPITELLGGMYDSSRPLIARLPAPMQLGAYALGYGRNDEAAPEASEAPPVSNQVLDPRDAMALRASAPEQIPTRRGLASAPGSAAAARPQARPTVPAEPDLASRMKTGIAAITGFVPPTDIEQRKAELSRLNADAAAQQRQDYEAYQASLPKDEYGAKAEARLKREAEEDPRKRKDALYMAMIEAGLGMLASESRNTWIGIGKGALQGVGSYKNAMKDLDASAKAREASLDAIDQARRAEKLGNAKEAYQFRKDAASLEAQAKINMFNVINAHSDKTRAENLAIVNTVYKAATEEDQQRREWEARKQLKQMEVHGHTRPIEVAQNKYLEAVSRGDVQGQAHWAKVMQALGGGERGALTQDKINDNIREHLKNVRGAQRAYDNYPEYREALIAAMSAGLPPPPVPDMSAVRVVPGSVKPAK
jgi:hypothetical protein